MSYYNRNSYGRRSSGFQRPATDWITNGDGPRSERPAPQPLPAVPVLDEPVEVWSAKRGEAVQSRLTDEDAIRICLTLTQGWIRDIAAKSQDRTPSGEQRFWLHKMGMEALERATTPRTPDLQVEQGGHAGVMAMFRHAAEHLKHPKILFKNAGGESEIVLAFATDTKANGEPNPHAGCVWVQSKGFWEERKRFGKIDPQGNFYKGRDCTDAVLAFLTEFAANPIEVAARYGRESGNCCFCARDLTDERSTTMGYGPVCAERFCLPWGGKNEEPVAAAPVTAKPVAEPAPAKKPRSRKKAEPVGAVEAPTVPFTLECDCKEHGVMTLAPSLGMTDTPFAPVVEDGNGAVGYVLCEKAAAAVSGGYWPDPKQRCNRLGCMCYGTHMAAPLHVVTDPKMINDHRGVYERLVRFAQDEAKAVAA